jgi:hypothetical protein
VKATTVSLLVALAVAVAPSASAHRGLHVKGYTSTLSGLEPNVLGVFANVIGGDDRLRLANYSGKTILVLGYAGEPYLRFEKQGVYENFRSPNAYLDRFRYPPGRAPRAADPKAPPRWVKVADGTTFEWHDHRIHWKEREAPPAVRKDPDRVHLIFNWRVPGRADGKRFLIKGFLGYSPPPRGDDGHGWIVPTAAGVGSATLAAALGLGLWGRPARRRVH